MKIRLLTLTAACAAALATTSIASPQDPAAKDCNGNGSRHHQWGDGLAHMTKVFDLTAEQQAKISPILEQAKPQIAAARQEARQAMKAIHDNTRSQIRPLLTAAQQTQLDAIQKAHDPAANDSRGNWPRHRHWGNGLAHMTKTLDLTAEQQAKIGPILEQAKPQIMAIRQESRQKTKAIRDSISSQLRPLLTASQQAKLDAIQKAREDIRKARQEMHEAVAQQ
jgi:Spy/CpxP family protein refolding chaperone